MLNKIHSSRDIYFIYFISDVGASTHLKLEKLAGSPLVTLHLIAPSTLSAPYSTASADTVADSV